MLRGGHHRRSSAAYRARNRENRSNGAESPQDHAHIPLRDAETPSTEGTTEYSDAEKKMVSDTDVDELASTMSAFKFVPPSVRFGRGGRRGGLSRT